MKPTRFLIIQTAFIGDVILATPVIESIHQCLPEVSIDFLLRKGNEGLLQAHPFLNKVWVWEKRKQKYQNQINLLRQLRREKYDYVINLQRFFSTGVFTALSGAQHTIGFNKNPLSTFFSQSHPHKLEPFIHEVDRNLSLLKEITPQIHRRPKLYPSETDYEVIASYLSNDYICIAPTSVWFTKQFPSSQWIKLIQRIPDTTTIYLLGGPGDSEACEVISQAVSHPCVQNLAGKLSLLQSAALMHHSRMNYVNDSAPMHMSSAMNAPTTAIFCSTVPRFGFGPLSEQAYIVETPWQLDCRPCHLHGLSKCPQEHFRCAFTIDVDQIPLADD